MRRICLSSSLLVLALACALTPPAARAGYSDGSIPDAIVACQGVPYDIVERDGDLYVACHGPTLDWMRFAAEVAVDDAVARVTINRTGAGSGRRALLRLRTADSTALAGRDYTAIDAHVYFDDHETSRTVDVPLIDDPGAIAPRSFRVTFADAAGQHLVVPATQQVVLPFAKPAGPVPAIAGHARAGESLTASAGPWSPAAESVGWQWERCAADGGGCTALADATGATLDASGHVGARLRVQVTAVNDAGTTILHSASTDVVRPALAAPSITGRPPATTTARDATFSFTGEAGSTFVCDVDGAGWEACGSPLARTGLALGPHSFGVRQLATDGASSRAASFAWTVVEKPARPEPEPRPEPRPQPEPAPEQQPRAEPAPVPAPAPAPRPAPRTQPSAGARGGGAGGGTPSGERGGGEPNMSRPRGRRVVFTATLHFCAGCTRPSARDLTLLRRLRERVRGAELLRIVGHADASGEAAVNDRLAQRRARSVARLLLSSARGRARPRRVEVRGAGTTMPVAPNGTLAGRAENRRVTIRIVARR